jgi:hypothetical protein
MAAPAGEVRFNCKQDGRDRISLRAALMKLKITPDGLGTREMSDRSNANH